MSFDEVWGEPFPPEATYIATGVDTCGICKGDCEQSTWLCAACTKLWRESPEHARCSPGRPARNRSMIADFVHRLRAESGER